MKIVFVTGDFDYGAIDFENWGGVERLKKETDMKTKFEVDDEKEGWQFYVRFFEFGEVDPKFIEFIRVNIHDYDDCKNTNFFVLD